MRLYVGNLPFGTQDDEMRALFEQHGAVESATIVTDRETGRSRGFGFVEMGDEEARRAIEQLDGYELGGRALTVNEARPKSERGGGGGGRRGGGRNGGGGGRRGGGGRY